jgi:group I intron endonuclease
MWVVYSHENIYNGMKYIGITSVRPERRWRNGEGYKRSVKFYNSIKKYGWDSFKHEILYENLTEKEAKNIEQKLIKKNKKQNLSYNITDGGEGNNGWVVSENTKKKISESHKGKKLSEEQKQKLKLSLKDMWKNNKHPMLGKQHSKESKEKNRMNQKNHINIYCYNTFGELVKIYNSKREIRAIKGMSINKIESCCLYNKNKPINICKIYKGYIYDFDKRI